MNYDIEIDGQPWHLTTEHAMSSYGLAVLVDAENRAYGTADLGPLQVTRAEPEALAALVDAGYRVVDS